MMTTSLAARATTTPTHRDIAAQIMREPASRSAASGAGALTESGFAIQAGRLFGRDADTDTRIDIVRRGAEELVSTAFIQPVFEMMRQDPLRAELTPLSKGEKTFGPMLDAELSKRIVRSARFPLVDAVARQLLQKSGVALEGATSAPPDSAPVKPDTYA